LYPAGTRHKLRSTRNGIFLINAHDTFVSRSLDLYGEWSESEVALFRLIVRPGDVVIDVGANIGAFTVPLLHMVGATGAVIAFEPQRPLFQLLNANVALNEFSNCFAYNQAVGSERGDTIVPRVNYSFTGNFGGISLVEDWASRGPFEYVERVRLDDYLPKLSSCPSFVKVDVEGMELDVLAGAQTLTKTCKPVWHVENNCVKGSEELIRYFQDQGGYVMFWDVHTYFSENNFYQNTEDVFTESYLSMNVLAVPEERRELLDLCVKRDMVRVNAGKFLLQDYVMKYKGRNVQIKQLGDRDSCKR